MLVLKFEESLASVSAELLARQATTTGNQLLGFFGLHSSFDNVIGTMAYHDQQCEFNTMTPTEETVPSPCILVCKLHAESQICVGCLRTRDEIARWSRADDTYKQAVVNILKERQKLGTKLFRAENAQT